jgi:hypothetical protein
MTAVAALAMISVASSADTAKAFVGTWVLSVTKSAFAPPPLKSQTITVTQTTESATHVTIATVYADGSSDQFEYTSANDGKAVSITGVNYIDSVTSTLLNPKLVKSVFTKAGKTYSTSTFAVSKSGKIMQGPLSGPNADGSVWKDHLVYARQ